MTFLVAAYALLWIGLFGYLLYLAARLRGLQRAAQVLAEELASERAPHPLEPTSRAPVSAEPHVRG